MHLKKDSWHLWFWSGDYIGRHDAEFVKTVQRYVKPCIKCTSDCQFGKDMTVFGNEFSYTCIQFPVQIVNPDFDALECVKALLEYWKTAQPNDFSWHYSG